MDFIYCLIPFIKITMCERIKALRAEADRFHEERGKREISRECNLIKTVISYIFNLDYVRLSGKCLLIHLNQ